MINSIVDNGNMASDEISLIGYNIDRLAGEGSFSRVYRMVDKDTATDYAVKIAKDRGEFFTHATGAFPTTAWSEVTGAFGEARPEPSDLLRKQYKGTIGIKCDGWVTVRDLRDDDGHAVAIMDWIDAPTLRDLIVCSSYSPELLIDIAKALSSLIDSGLKLYHGDLKPDNILVVDGVPQLIDPGYFGPLLVYFDREIDMAVTTWQYYPWLKPDDMCAFGIMALEMCTGVHPFSEGLGLNRDRERLGPVLSAYIEQVSSSNNQFVRSIECIPAFIDRFRDRLPKELQQIALRCLGLEEDDGLFELAPVFETFSELAEALSRVDFPEEIVYYPNHHFVQDNFDLGNSAVDETSIELKQPQIISAGIPVGVSVVSGDDCACIADKRKVGNEFHLVLTPLAEDKSEKEYSDDDISDLVIEGTISIGASNFVALTLSRDFTSEDPYVTVWIAKVINRKLVMPATMDEISQISESSMEKPTLEKLEKVFGEGAF